MMSSEHGIMQTVQWTIRTFHKPFHCFRRHSTPFVCLLLHQYSYSDSFIMSFSSTQSLNVSFSILCPRQFFQLSLDTYGFSCDLRADDSYIIFSSQISLLRVLSIYTTCKLHFDVSSHLVSSMFNYSYLSRMIFLHCLLKSTWLHNRRCVFISDTSLLLWYLTPN